MPALMPVVKDGLRLGSADFAGVMQVFSEAVENREKTKGQVVVDLMDIFCYLGEQPDMPLELDQETLEKIQTMCIALAELCGFSVQAPRSMQPGEWFLILS